jgi:hypothetical protein
MFLIGSGEAYHPVSLDENLPDDDSDAENIEKFVMG